MTFAEGGASNAVLPKISLMSDVCYKQRCDLQRYNLRNSLECTLFSRTYIRSYHYIRLFESKASFDKTNRNVHQRESVG